MDTGATDYCPDDTCDMAAVIYTCPMHPEIRQQGPGACPKCGMALEPVSGPVAGTRTEYTCPMHPEVVQDHPGNCPKCGMTLEARTVAAQEDTRELDTMTRRFWVSTVLALPVSSCSPWWRISRPRGCPPGSR